LFISINKDSKSGKVDWYTNGGAFTRFTNNVNCYVDFVEDKFQFDFVVLSGGEEYKVTKKEIYYLIEELKR
jgi:hypothetical protein